MGLRFFVTEEVARYRATESVEVAESRVLAGFHNFYERRGWCSDFQASALDHFHDKKIAWKLAESPENWAS